MPRAIVYQTARNQPKTGIVMIPVAEGLKRNGWTVDMRESMQYPRGDENDTDLLAVWGDNCGAERILADTPRLQAKVLQIDNGYTDRRRYDGHYSVSYGARQCHRYLWESARREDRFLRLGETIHPWRTHGDTILILAPSHKQGRFLGFDSVTWARQIRDLVSRQTKRKVVAQIKTYNVDKPLRDTLRDDPIFACVGYNTKGLVDCLLYGIPVFNVAPCVTERMGLQDLSKVDTPYYPENRQEFFERLAWHQFLLSEIADGLPFREGVMPG